MLRDIPGLEGIYAASDDGHIWSYKINRFLSEHINKNGYYCVHIITDKDRIVGIHRLVALAFLPNEDKKETVDHIDRDKTNNKVSNLRWATFSEQNSNKNWTEKMQNAASKGGLTVSRKVECRDIKDHSILINTFSSSYQAAIQMFGDAQKNSLIHRCASGKRKSAYGYWWCFVDN